MCGIAGIVGAPAPERAVLERMAAAMSHRGPDDQGLWADATAGLAFRRLAVIDLDPRSNQPLHHRGLHLVFNGEIYNYRELRADLAARGHAFDTEGDGEVLLHAWSEWGESALDRLNGMFALAVWDERERSLTLACDRFGEKPLYWCQLPGRLAFGSDIRALMQASLGSPGSGWSCAGGLGRPDERAVEVFVARNLMPAPDGSFFEGVNRLPAAHALRWTAGRIRVWRWWRPATVEVPARYEDAVRALRELLIDSIRLRLRSDVPVGSSLSGGIDSSAVVMLSAELGREHRRHAFTAAFEGHERDEWAYARAVAAAAEVAQHHAVRPTSDELAADLDQLVLDHEEPFASASIYAQWRVNRAAREAGVVVLLDGQGADELFGGYPWMVGTAAVARGPRAVLRALRAGGWQRTATVRALLGAGLPRRVVRAYQRRAASPYVAADARERALQFDPPVPAFSSGSAMRRELLLEAFTTSLPALLRYADRSSMAHSREVRLPYLDPRVAEFALSAPAAFLCRGPVTKRILRDAVRGLVPEVVLARRDKVAFDPPQARWLAEPRWRERIAEVLLDPATRARGLYDARAVEADLRAGAWRDHAAIWRALCAETWRRALTASPTPAAEPVR